MSFSAKLFTVWLSLSAPIMPNWCLCASFLVCYKPWSYKLYHVLVIAPDRLMGNLMQNVHIHCICNILFWKDQLVVFVVNRV